MGPCGERARVPQVFVQWGWVSLWVLFVHVFGVSVASHGMHTRMCMASMSWVLTASLRVAPAYLPDCQPIPLLSPAPGEESEGQGSLLPHLPSGLSCFHQPHPTSNLQ